MIQDWNACATPSWLTTRSASSCRTSLAQRERTGSPSSACLASCSNVVSHRILGQLGRIEGAAKELIRGNLGLRIRLRKGDDLQALAGFMNEAVDNLVQAIRVIKESETSVREILSGLVDEVQKRPSGNGEMLNRLNKALKDSQRIEQVLQKFQFSTPSR